MKQTTKKLFGVMAIVLLSSGVAGFTTYTLMKCGHPFVKKVPVEIGWRR